MESIHVSLVVSLCSEGEMSEVGPGGVVGWVEGQGAQRRQRRGRGGRGYPAFNSSAAGERLPR